MKGATGGRVTIAGLSEMFELFPEMRRGQPRDFLSITLPHIIKHALNLVEICR